MPKPKVLALVMAGGEGSRLELLTDRRAKPAVPFAGVFRLIDFPLSNCVHSGIEDVWVLQQYRLQSLNDELANGRPWDLDRTYGGLRLLPPQLGSGEEDGFHEGNADAIWRNRQLIAEYDPEVVLVLSADHVYRLDYGEVLARHRDRGAGVTVVTTEVPDEREASRLSVVRVAGDGRLRGFHYKPDEPPTTRVATEVFAFETGRLLATLDELAAGDGELKDFGHGLLPRMVDAGEAVEHRMAGYWRDVGTVPAYWQAHMDLLDPERPLELDDPAWPVLGRAPHRLPARVEGSARLDRALLSPGTTVCGEVTRSVLGRGWWSSPARRSATRCCWTTASSRPGPGSSGRCWTGASGSGARPGWAGPATTASRPWSPRTPRFRRVPRSPRAAASARTGPRRRPSEW
jgi:glucose-1-phosphate adenylyltransferase